ncbi:hypothetical protein [Edwardsiella tarda]|uniref:hypothetical protein n=1 Tax=Edwardsiella tarda TaxID=636 RepID=UPI000D508A2E|nr:hypothetical protein DCF76_16885 [Edwardsiella tarda]
MTKKTVVDEELIVRADVYPEQGCGPVDTSIGTLLAELMAITHLYDSIDTKGIITVSPMYRENELDS